ncbi:MAG: ABC transporter permease [Acidobacteria bacterium]|nr:ABC transporter permease [Acidobacteriota bacterium]MBI3489398.1 ABC transporter permease [Acidobacteriota bacterium]
MFIHQFLMECRLYARDRGTLFWTFLFPVLVFLALGATIQDNPEPSLVWVKASQKSSIDASFRVALEQVSMHVQEVEAKEAEARWRRGETAIQMQSEGAGYRLRINHDRLAQGRHAAQVVQQVFLLEQAKRSGTPAQLIPVSMESSGRPSVPRYAAFLLPGLIGLNLVSIGLFSLGMVNVTYREQGFFRSLAVTPLPRWIFLSSQIMQRWLVVMVQATLLLATGWLAFGIHNQGSQVSLFLLLTLGCACFMSMGFAVASLARTAASYGILSNALYFPMLMLSGVYFSMETAPSWMQRAVVVLPLSPFLRALRGVMNDGAPLLDHAPGLVMVVAWTALAFSLAAKRFSWH